MVFSHLLKQKLGHLRQHASRHASVESSPVIGCPSGRILMHRCVRPTAASVAGATLLACYSCGNAQQTRTRSARVGWRQFEQLRGVAARRVVDGDVEGLGHARELGYGVRLVGVMVMPPALLHQAVPRKVLLAVVVKSHAGDVQPAEAQAAQALEHVLQSVGHAVHGRLRQDRKRHPRCRQRRHQAVARLLVRAEDGGEGAEVHGVRPVCMMALEDVAVEAIDDEQAPLPQAAGVGWQQRKHVVREHERVIGAAIDAASDGRVCWTVEEQRCVRQRA